jgi:hypothetical protein
MQKSNNIQVKAVVDPKPNQTNCGRPVSKEILASESECSVRDVQVVKTAGQTFGIVAIDGV